ncbi:MAG: TolC family protein, partial [Bacteroidales bacterium]
MLKKIVLIGFWLFCSALSLMAQQSLLLDKYRALALAYSHDLKSAEKNLSVSIELEKMAKAERKPKLSGDIDAQYIGNPMSLNVKIPSIEAPLSFQGTHFQYGASLSLLQPIYTGGRILENIKLAKNQQNLATNQMDLLRSSICFQTDIQYWNTVTRYQMVKIASDFRNSIAELVLIIKERVEVGLVDPQDLLMAEVKLNEAEYALLQTQNAFETGRMALNAMIGIELQNPT